MRDATWELRVYDENKRFKWDDVRNSPDAVYIDAGSLFNEVMSEYFVDLGVAEALNAMEEWDRGERRSSVQT
jgi:hypothetical protein